MNTGHRCAVPKGAQVSPLAPTQRGDEVAGVVPARLQPRPWVQQQVQQCPVVRESDRHSVDCG